MLIVMNAGHSPSELQAVVAKIEKMGFTPHVMPGANSTAIGITGNPGPLDPKIFEILPGVKEALRVTKPYKLPSRDFHPHDTEIAVRDGKLVVGGRKFVVMAGPCSVESETQMLTIARHVAAAGAHMLRGGCFKPRSSVYAFQGLGEDGLKILAAAREETGLPVITEALDQRTLELVVDYADVVQIGARNMQNYGLLRDVGRIDKPVMLKRGMSATLEEWLQAAEYVLAEGNPNVMLCERGIRTFATHTRNTFDLNVIPVVREKSHLPIIADPSHGTGLRRQVGPMARAAAAIPSHGLMIEVHHDPDAALSDGPQSLLPAQFATLMDEIRAMAKFIGFEFAGSETASMASVKG